MQMAEVTTRDEQRVFETAVPKTASPSEFSVEPALQRLSPADEDQTNSGAEVRQADVQAAGRQPDKVEVSGELAAVEASHGRNGDERLEEPQAAAVTMADTTESVAVTSSGSPRWTAGPVALRNDETSRSLDRRSQKADAAIAAA